MKIIRSKEELEGTCYIEVLSGKYVGQCWNEDSIFFDEEVFGDIEKSTKTEFPEYDHYAFNEIQRENGRLYFSSRYLIDELPEWQGEIKEPY